ncbi:MAG: radical SAM protein [Proteobacteria bacterium]|nr:radical SAM protein [Pseudomonadota bacterium]MBU1710632.1 radical SAM protein [Pseudomonadota bacterium]
MERESFIEGNRQEFGEQFDSLNWVTTAQTVAAEEQRRGLLAELAGNIKTCCNGAKLYTHALSPGCRLCTEGAWSCLFINGICNGRCFYCPADQTHKGEPTTNTLQFSAAKDYVDYLSAFKIRGAGISGGEPLLTFDRTVQYVEKIKKRHGAGLHVWMYTNGILLTPDKLAILKDAGLDEIRFDISADGYSLDKVSLAVGVIANVTVEIPAIPEDAAILRDSMVRISDLGVNYLNLHQLRCTTHNREKLLSRPYTFLHGPKVTVLESELTALEMLRFAVDRKLGIAVNYCSFIYRHRYQNMGVRRRGATVFVSPHETITAAGNIRSLALGGSPEELDELVKVFEQNDPGEKLWSLNGQKTRLVINVQLLPLLDPHRFPVHVTYFGATLKPSVTYRNPYREIKINPGKKIVVERRALSGELLLDEESVRAFRAGCFPGGDIQVSLAAPDESAILKEIRSFEETGSGLLSYF